MNGIEATGAKISKAYLDAASKRKKPAVSPVVLSKEVVFQDIQVPKFVPKQDERRKDDGMIAMPTSGPFGMPVMGRISSEFSPARLHPVHHVVKRHKGIDIAAPKGTPVRATGDGVIVFRGVQNGFGKIVQIQHPNGMSTKYAHLDSFTVNQGDSVKRNDVIGTVGKTGTATGYHLHYEVLSKNTHVDPKEFL